MINPTRPALLLALALPLAATAQSFVFKDWAVACDNTRHCEAVGYQAENSDGEAVAMQLARDAGPNTPVNVMLRLAVGDKDSTALVSLKAGWLDWTGIRPDQVLGVSQSRQLLPAMLKADAVLLSDGKTHWKLSLAGLNAALLKMDDLQGRIGTPEALVRKGSKPETGVLPPLPAPKVRLASLPAASSDNGLLKPILQAVKERGCFNDMPDQEHPETSIARVSGTQVLVMRECSRGAYQGSSALWLANSKPPYVPKAVLLPTPSGKPTDSIMNAGFDKGRLSSYAKGRGIGDCGDSMEWGWTGTQFQLISASEAPLCRGLLQGGFALRLWQAEVSR